MQETRHSFTLAIAEPIDGALLAERMSELDGFSLLCCCAAHYVDVERRASTLAEAVATAIVDAASIGAEALVVYVQPRPMGHAVDTALWGWLRGIEASG